MENIVRTSNRTNIFFFWQMKSKWNAQKQKKMKKNHTNTPFLVIFLFRFFRSLKQIKLFHVFLLNNYWTSLKFIFLSVTSICVQENENEKLKLNFLWRPENYETTKTNDNNKHYSNELNEKKAKRKCFSFKLNLLDNVEGELTNRIFIRQLTAQTRKKVFFFFRSVFRWKRT